MRIIVYTYLVTNVSTKLIRYITICQTIIQSYTLFMIHIIVIMIIIMISIDISIEICRDICIITPSIYIYAITKSLIWIINLAGVHSVSRCKKSRAFERV